MSEAANLEPRPDERGAYTRAKLEAEQLVTAASGGLPAVILRPGQIFGGGIPLINGAVARSIPGSGGGRWLILGDGKLELTLVYIDDVVDAILAAVARKLTRGEVIQIIDPEHLTQENVLGLAGGDKAMLRVPRPVVFALGKLSEYPLGALGRPSPVAVYRLKSALARLHHDSDRAATMLGWRPARRLRGHQARPARAVARGARENAYTRLAGGRCADGVGAALAGSVARRPTSSAPGARRPFPPARAPEPAQEFGRCMPSDHTTEVRYRSGAGGLVATASGRVTRSVRGSHLPAP